LVYSLFYFGNRGMRALSLTNEKQEPQQQHFL
jgi:hypothetical protein